MVAALGVNHLQTDFHWNRLRPLRTVPGPVSWPPLTDDVGVEAFYFGHLVYLEGQDALGGLLYLSFYLFFLSVCT